MRNFIRTLFVFLLTTGCVRFDNKKRDQNNTQRIVCISKQYAEIIYALGAQEKIVAVDLSSTYPLEVTKLPTIGYHRALSAEPILAMNPTLILHDNNIGPEHVVRQLEKLKIPISTFGAYESTIEGTDSLIREMGVYFNRENEGEKLCAQLHHDLKAALEKSKEYSVKPKVLIIHYGRASNVNLVMTKNSTAAQMLAWAGGEVTVDAEKSMMQLSPEIVAASNPDVILLTDFGYDRLKDGEEIDKLPGVSSTKAYKTGQVFRIEEHDLVYLGPRTGKNVLLIQKLIHSYENY